MILLDVRLSINVGDPVGLELVELVLWEGALPLTGFDVGAEAVSLLVILACDVVVNTADNEVELKGVVVVFL